MKIQTLENELAMGFRIYCGYQNSYTQMVDTGNYPRITGGKR